MIIDPLASGYLLSELELKILLAGCGFDSFFGLLNESAQEAEDKPKLLKTIADMSADEKLWSDGDCFHISAPLEAIVRQIGSAHGVLLVNAAGSINAMCCYCGNVAVVCEAIPSRNNMLRLSSFTHEEFAEKLICMLDFPDCSFQDSPLTQEQLWNQKGSTVFSAELYLNQRPHEKAEVFISAVSPPEIIITSSSDSCRMPFSNEALFNKLLYMIKSVSQA